ncbi:glycosyltransferase [Chitinophaga sp. Hz27]|uniref:glycosyltransferase n=1 Tax=Chitinophaga sp. Hz27 TaxID=3347169 RepID=UPI0035D64231
MNTRHFSFAFIVDNYISHFYALSGVALRLQQAGHRVIFYCPDKIQHVIIAAGFPCMALPIFMNGGAPSVSMSRKQCRAYFRQKAAEILTGARLFRNTSDHDYLIMDPFMLMYWPALHAAGFKGAAVSTKPLLSRDRWAPPYTSAYVPSKAFGSSWRVAVAWWRQQWNYYLGYRFPCKVSEWLKGYSHRTLTLYVAKQSGFDLKREWATRPLSYDLRFKSVPELVLHAREMDFPRKRSLRANVAYLGPCTNLPESSTDIELPAGNGPLIWVNLGTVAKQRKELLQGAYVAIADAIKLLPSFRAVIATADIQLTAQLKSQLQGQEHRVIVATWIERGSVLQAADIVVTHGGSNSVKEAIFAGKPILAIPHSADQPGMAARLVYHKLGMMCTSPQPLTLSKMILELTNNKEYQKNSCAMSEIFLRYDENTTCVNILEQLVTDDLHLAQSKKI